jgi:hypothetical protein
MKDVLIIMSDNRQLDDFASCDYNSLAAFINYKYCERKNYKFLYFRPHNNFDFGINNCYSPSGKLRHSAWAKILSTILATKKNNDYIFYIDSDCIFNNHDLNVESYFTNLPKITNNKIDESNLFFLNDKPWHPDAPCSGFFYLKNNSKSINLLKDWYYIDDIEDEQFNLKHCWEQWSLYKLIKKNENQITIFDDDMFLDVFPHQFLRHIGTHEKHLRIPFFKKKITDLGFDNYDYNEFLTKQKEFVIEYNTNFIFNL